MLFLLFVIMPIVSAEGFIGATYLTITIGVFVSLAFFIVTFILWKHQLSVGPWILISFVALCITVSEFFRVFVNSSQMHQLFLTSSMILLFIVAVVKYWDTLQLIQ
ncbi:MAG: hypothetical protein U9O94_02910 [Nanoarchaeota archaeon]|nr:hypothetical protein [Nanoarchaeota archaeon]